MKLIEYQMLSSRTRRTDLSKEEQIKNCLMGIAGEAGEIVDKFKKHYYQGHTLEPREVVFEIGDLLFYQAWLCDLMGYTLEEAGTMNIQKIWDRYREGFSEEDSQNREEYKGVFLDEKW